jgi:cytochrome c oxidase subunit 2
VIDPASEPARAIYAVMLWVLVIAAAIFLTMGSLIVVAMVRFRHRPGGAAEQAYGSETHEIAWMVGPILVVIWLGFISAKLILTVNTMPRADPQDKMQADLIVVGHQWWWEVRDLDSKVVTANEIHIPVGKKLRVELRSADVIHCFWVPQLARKLDVIPGWKNHLMLVADKPGVYQGFCAEFCGAQHAWMRFLVIAQSQEDFDAWVAEQRQPRAQPADDVAAAGERIFESRSCIECHAMGGTGSDATIGPNLTKVSTRRLLAGGALTNTPEHLAQWLKDPQAVKPGCKMPDFKLSNEEVAQLVAYLEGKR